MVADLSVEFCGIKFKNPFLLASTPAARPERWVEAALVGRGESPGRVQVCPMERL
ncbi:hypothetical protein ACFLWV_02125 [Chloroflexota bacterium]